MGICARLSRRITATLNRLVDAAEDLLFTELMRESDDALAAARRYAALAIAAERGIGRELEQNRTAVSRWQGVAREALLAGREDLARHALCRKHEHENLSGGLETQAAAARQMSMTARASLRRLEARLTHARRLQRALLVRRRGVRARAECFHWFGADRLELEAFGGREADQEIHLS